MSKGRKAWPSNKLTRISSVTLLSVFTFLCGCGQSWLKEEVSNYRGDGVIAYLPAPGIGGVAGCAITLPPFDLGEGVNRTYSLNGLPSGGPYRAYLVIPDNIGGEALADGTCGFRYLRDGQAVGPMVATGIAAMRDYIRGADGVHRFYVFDPTQPRTDVLNATEGHIYAIHVVCSNVNLNVKVDAYVEVARGGFK